MAETAELLFSRADEDEALKTSTDQPWGMFKRCIGISFADFTAIVS